MAKNASTSQKFRPSVQSKMPKTVSNQALLAKTASDETLLAKSLSNETLMVLTKDPTIPIIVKSASDEILSTKNKISFNKNLDQPASIVITPPIANNYSSHQEKIIEIKESSF